MSLLKPLLALMAMAAMFEIAISTNYTVGAPSGSWDLQTNYIDWVSDKTFYPGDYLLFTYVSPHDVWEVGVDDYETCAKGSPIKQYSGGNTLIALTEATTRYFFCSTANHCASGQKIAVLVASSNTTDSPPSPSSPGSSPPPSPTKSGASAREIEICEMIALAFGAILMILV